MSSTRRRFSLSSHVNATWGPACVAAMLMIALAAVPARAQVDDSSSEEGYIVIELPGIASRDFTVRFAGDTLLLPFSRFCEFLRLNNVVSPDLSEVSAEIPAGHIRTLSLSAGTGRKDSAAITFSRSRYRVIEGDIYIDYLLLADLFDISMQFDLNALRLQIIPDERIPLVASIRNRGRYAALASPEEGGPASVSGAIHRPLFGAMAIDWSIFSSYRDHTADNAAAVQIGMPFLYGTLDLRGGGTFRPRDSIPFIPSFGSWSWMYQLPDFALLRQITLSGHGPQSYALQLTNVPLAPRRSLGFHDLAGETQPGWTLEMYDGQRLVAVTNADSLGRYRFRIPVGYGSIDRTVVQLGPHGERIENEEHIQLNQRLLPPGAVDYTAVVSVDSIGGAGAGTGLIHAGAGVLEWLSLGAEAELRLVPLRLSGSRNIWDSIVPVLFADMWLGGSSALGVRFSPRSGSLSGEFNYIAANNGTLGLRVDSVTSRVGSITATGTASMPVGRFYVGGSGSYRGGSVVVAPRFSGYMAGIGFSLETEMRLASPRVLGEAAIQGDGPGLFRASTFALSSSLIRGVFLNARGNYSYLTRTLALLEINSRFAITNDLGLDLGYRLHDMDWKNGQVNLRLSLSTGLGRFSAGASGNAADYLAYSMLQGSLLVSSSGIEADRNSSMGRSGIVVRAFHDRNVNGVRDDGEESLDPPDVTLQMDGNSMRGHGEFLHLDPNRGGAIEVNRWGMAEGGVYPTRTHFGVYTLPDHIEVIDVPFTEGFDLDGTCVVDFGAGGKRAVSGLNGLRIVLASTSGDGEYEGEIFSDGSITVAGVSQGEYTIRFDAGQLAYRRITPRDLPATVRVTGQIQHLPEIVFVPMPEETREK